jgi:uncharacterized protein DUF6966
MPLHPDIQELLDAMRALQSHLENVDDVWAARVRKAADEVAKSDAHGLQRFLGFFGGMGSLSDVALHREGDALRREAWALADALRRQFN